MLPKPVQVRRSETIEVSYDPNICSHAAECLRGLPQVFDLQARPWIQPDHAEADAIADVIRRCPSGALRYHRFDGGPEEVPDAAPSFRPQPNGPIYVRGAVELSDAEGNGYSPGPRFALCRCGESGNKPFCDGAHRAAGFQAP